MTNEPGGTAIAGTLARTGCFLAFFLSVPTVLLELSESVREGAGDADVTDGSGEP